jgi:hypothetical protein
MLCQEEVIEFFEKLALDLKENYIPILNELGSDYPGFMSKDEIQDSKAEYNDSEEEDLYY